MLFVSISLLNSQQILRLHYNHNSKSAFPFYILNHNDLMMRIGLTGTPGVGKTTVASILSARFTVIKIVDLAAEKGYLGSFDDEFGAKEIDIESLASALEKEWQEPAENTTVIEGHLSHYLPCDLVIVLRCAPEILRSRLSQRGYPEWKINDNVEWELLGGPWNEMGPDHVPWIEFDTTFSGPEEICDLIEKSLGSELDGTESSSVLDWAEDIGGL